MAKQERDKVRATVSELGAIIDTSWRSSWHWHTDRFGLTAVGRQQALHDCRARMRDCITTMARLHEAETALLDDISLHDETIAHKRPNSPRPEPAAPHPDPSPPAGDPAADTEGE